MSLIEAVPNVSEGRRLQTVATIAHAWTRREDAWLLDVHSDASHHRSVMTAALSPDAVVEASCDLAQACIDAIDLEHHEGVHPRIGALDVLPFIPLGDVASGDAIELARTAASELARRFDIPVFLYGKASPHRAPIALHQLRRGGLRVLQRRMDTGELTPAFGPRRLHQTAGAIALGVRDFLIAYNVALESADVELATAIARSVRESSGGLAGVQALGVALPHRNLVQCSMNLTDFRTTSLRTVFDAVRQHAASRNVGIDHSEIVGLIPADAAFDDMVTELMLEHEPGILEDRLRETRAR